jgi:signal transduction histidine kinase/CHASE1-domain containing sensor protein
MKRALRRPQPWFVFAAGLALTAVAVWSAAQAVAQRREAAFDAAIEAAVGRLNTQLESYESLLRATRAFMESSTVSRAAFDDFVGRIQLHQRYPGLRGIGWTPRLRDADHARTIAEAAHADGLERFRIWADGGAEPRFAIQYLAPLDVRNVAALGFDMSSEPVRRAAMQRAAADADAALSGPVVLKQEMAQRPDQGAPGFLIYLPLYDARVVPPLPAQRLAALAGYVYSPLRAGDFFPTVFDVARDGFAVRIVDGDVVLFDSRQSRDSAGFAQRERAFDHGGRRWLLQFDALPGLRADPLQMRLSFGVGVLGLLLSLALLWVAGRQMQARLALADTAAAREAALAQETRQRAVAESLSRVALQLGAELDAERAIQRVTDEATRLTGAAFGAYFHNVADADGRYGLYTLAGAAREHFERFPPVRATPLFAATFGGRTLRLADVTKSELFGHNPPYNGMPAGHLKVTSYLAACVRTRSGQVLGGLFLGHPEADRFTAEHETLAEGLAAQAGSVLENLQLLASERAARLDAEQRRQQLHAVNQALARSNRELDQFAYVASHDLKAPLRGIGNLAQWIEEDSGDALPAAARGHLQMLRGRLQRMEALIEGILAYSRAGRETGPAQPVDMAELLQETLLLLAPPPQLRVEATTPLPVLMGERTALQQVLLNLVGNAIKHAGGGAEPRVAVSARLDEGGTPAAHWVLTVRDNGPGIEPQYHDRIWGMFQTLQSRDRVEGTGIGLAVVRKIVQAQGGRTWVESAPGAGAAFHFTWPAATGEAHTP